MGLVINMNTFYPGTKVYVYDHIDDKWKSATVIKWYGYFSSTMAREYGKEAGRYPSLVDVMFNDGKISDAHFTDSLYSQ